MKDPIIFLLTLNTSRCGLHRRVFFYVYFLFICKLHFACGFEIASDDFCHEHLKLSFSTESTNLEPCKSLYYAEERFK